MPLLEAISSAFIDHQVMNGALDRKFGCAEERMLEVGILALLMQGIENRLLQVLDVVGYEVRQAGVFRVVPYPLHGIQVRRVARQPLEVNPIALGFTQQPSRFAMHAPAIPHENDRATQMPSQLFEKRHDVFGAYVVVEKFKVHADSPRPGSERQSADGAEPVMSIPGVLNGRLAARGPSAATKGLQHEAAFVEKHDASASSSLRIGVF